MMAGSFLGVCLENDKTVPVTRQNLHFPAKPGFLQCQTRQLWKTKHVFCLQLPSLQSQSASPKMPTQLLALERVTVATKLMKYNTCQKNPSVHGTN
jgi:hypothetical protein